VNGHALEEVATVCLAASIFDETPEGRSIVQLAQELGAQADWDETQAEGIEFSARTRMSGTDIASEEYRKGAVDSIKGFVRSRSGKEQMSSALDEAYERVSRFGAMFPTLLAII
jgi:K+-transporting ATPase ATPase B chain